MAEFLATLVPALGHALLHFLWQGALIGLLAALALHALRHARPQARYAVACLALLACVLVPLVTVIAHLVATSSASLYAATPAPLPRISASLHASGVLLGFAPTAPFDAFLPWIVALWAAGTCAMSLRMALGLAWIHRLRSTPQGAAQAAWQVRLDALAMHFDLRRSVALRLVDTLDSPVSAGWWRPVVLLPTALLTRMPADLIEALLAHELAHIRRHDYLVNLMQNAVEAVLFYHPVTWWLSHRIRVEREQIADQLAAEVVCAPRRLALALAELADLQCVHPAFQLAQAARGGQLMSRIEQLVRPVRRAHPSARIVFPLLGLAALCIASYAYAQIGKSVPNAMQPASRAAQTYHTYNASVRDYAQIDKPVPNAMQPAPRATQSSRTHNAPARDYAQIDKPVPIAMQPARGATQVSRVHNASARDTFALVRKGGNDILIRGPNDDMTTIEAAKLGLGGDLLWAYRGGQAYVVTDPSLYARARQAWRRAEVLSQQLETLSSQMEAHQRRRDALAARQDALPVQPTEVRGARRAARLAMDDVARRQRELERRQGELARLQRAARSETEHQQLARERDALTAKQGELADALVRLHEQYSAAMETEARKQDELENELVRLQTEVMDIETSSGEMQQQFATLSRERNQAADQATREVRNLISEALAKGLAKPAPTPVPAQ
ncbi:M56 family metallopeptidase [Lysobacter sp. CFH 32150]|uniref:M56 family metallopeptidase n=1 Tax=Lysobacter sp. CFH 32150 TaxID=2927128 RepID=UPI001FA7A816|nr:M56 family metallopeptidase [Lysobacter sp. CFH 32150]MCI4566664.1 M48 family metalloprotease [Lysobacter sp. CFH 32150]